MNNKKFLIPDGIEYFMPDEALKFESLKQKALRIFDKYAYKYVLPPIFDDLNNLFSLNSADLDKETVSINDYRLGGKIGIRADITPQISKIDYQFAKNSNISKYCYMGDILRSHAKDFDRKNPFQLGAEIFGDITKDNDIEIIKLMLEIIFLSNNKKIILDLGNLSFINNFLSKLDLNKEQKHELVTLLNYKAKTDIYDFCKKNKINKNKLNFLISIIDLSGDIAVIKEIKKFIKYYKIDFNKELNELDYIARKILKFNSSCQVQIDLCELHGYEYQNNLIYTLYTPSFRKDIARGGRYKAYKISKNQYRNATGFSLDLKDIFNISNLKRKAKNA